MSLGRRARRRLAARGDLPAVLAAEAADAAAVARRREALDARRSKRYDRRGQPRQSPRDLVVTVSISTAHPGYYHTDKRIEP